MAEEKKAGRAAAKPKSAKTRSERKQEPARPSAAPAPETAGEASTAPEASPAAPPATGTASPLDGRPGSGAEGAVMAEHPHLGKITLRGDPADQAFLHAVRGAVGAIPPLEANTVATAGGMAICWLGPDEWLIVTPAGRQEAVEVALNSALDGRHAAIVDTTDARTTIRIHGPHARDVLAKGCPLDLHPRAFGPGQCAQTLIAKADVLIHQLDEAPTYDIYVLCSFARYLWDWLVDASLEFS